MKAKTKLMNEATSNATGETFAELFEATSAALKEGEVVAGTVLSIDDENVQIDIGFKSEGLIPTWEFMDDDGTLHIKVGDRIEVLLEEAEDANGRIVLSKEKADRLKVWDDISKAYKAEEPVEGVVVARVKGGLAVDIGVKAFLPGSQVDLRPVRNLEHVVNQRLKFKVIKFNKRRGNIVLSRRALLETERKQAPRRNSRNTRARTDRRWRDQEPDGLRGVHRSRWHRWVAARDGHVVGSSQSSREISSTWATRSR